MPPRRRKPPAGPLRKALEGNLEAPSTREAVAGHAALVELARVLADELDREPAKCFECGGHPGPSPQVAARYADALAALGIGRVAPAEEEDPFTVLRREFDEARRARANA